MDANRWRDFQTLLPPTIIICHAVFPHTVWRLYPFPSLVSALPSRQWHPLSLPPLSVNPLMCCAELSVEVAHQPSIVLSLTMFQH